MSVQCLINSNSPQPIPAFTPYIPSHLPSSRYCLELSSREHYITTSGREQADLIPTDLLSVRDPLCCTCCSQHAVYIRILSFITIVLSLVVHQCGILPDVQITNNLWLYNVLYSCVGVLHSTPGWRIDCRVSCVRQQSTEEAAL